MTGRTPTVPPRPAASEQRAGRARLMLSRLWANRPTLGTLACLLAVPGIVNVLFGWPLWKPASVQWSLWVLLMVAVSLLEVRRLPTSPTDPDATTNEHTPDQHTPDGHTTTAEEADQ